MKGSIIPLDKKNFYNEVLEDLPNSSHHLPQKKQVHIIMLIVYSVV